MDTNIDHCKSELSSSQDVGQLGHGVYAFFSFFCHFLNREFFQKNASNASTLKGIKIFDSTMTMLPQDNSVCKSAFYHLRHFPYTKISIFEDHQDSRPCFCVLQAWSL